MFEGYIQFFKNVNLMSFIKTFLVHLTSTLEANPLV